MPLFLGAFALGYYSLYVNAGLNPGGEGGTIGVVAMRLLEGQRPIIDTFLGYNVLWFLPVTWLFEVGGPNYLVLRWYFFAICTATGLLTYFLVRGYTRNTWFSALPAILVILVPGMMFRNYMGFLGVFNAFLLTRAFVMPRESSWKTLGWMLGSGAGLGLTYLFRIDLGIFSTLIFVGLAVLYPLGEREKFLRRGGLALLGAVGGLLLAWAVHLPVWNDAKARGYDRDFLDQYTGWFGMIRSELGLHLTDLAEKPSSEPVAVSAAPVSTPPAPVVAHEETQESSSEKAAAESWEDRGALARVPASNIFLGKKWTDKAFALSTYVPIFLSMLVILLGGMGLLVALVRRDREAKERMLYPLTVLGCSLMLLPQFLFFRPDTPHLSEMMVPFLSALALITWAAGRHVRTGKSRVGRVGAGGIGGICIAMGATYFSHGFPKESAGSIAAKNKVSHEFRALNGVRVIVRDRDAAWLSGVRDAILRHSSPGEYVLCLPYSPTINFMTDRPSPLHNLYVDNSTAGHEFNAHFADLMSRTSPAVVVIDQRRINRNEISRFRNWAPIPYQWLRDNYTYYGRYYRSEVFIRKDKVHGPVVPEAIEVTE